MSGETNRRLTFAMLEGEKSSGELPTRAEEEYPLPSWYRSVREIPLEQLSVEDICKACRQQIHLDHVVPIALRILQSNPLAGEMYDGELIASLKSVPGNYWSNRSDEGAIVRRILERAISVEPGLDDVRQDAEELLRRISPSSQETA